VTTTTAPSSFLPMLVTRFPSYERSFLARLSAIRSPGTRPTRPAASQRPRR
jgi:hypothetical protein